MADPTNILGKIGKKVGEELKGFRTTSDNKYATQVSLGNTDGRVSINSSAIVSLGNAIISLGNSSGQDYVTKVSLNNYKTGVNVFTDLSATRASIGDLTVTGTTTTLNTQTVVIEDNIIEVNLKSDGTESAQTGGIQINRGLPESSLSKATFNIGAMELSVECEPELFSDYSQNPNNPDLIKFHTPAGAAVSPQNGGKFLKDSENGSIHYYPNSSSQSYNVLFNGNSEVSPDLYEMPADLSAFTDPVQITDTKGFKLVLVSGGSESMTSDQQAQFFTSAGDNGDKATIIWDDNTGQSMFKFGLGSSDADIKVKDVNASGTVAVSSGNNLTINTVALGDYSEFTAGLTLGKA